MREFFKSRVSVSTLNPNTSKEILKAHSRMVDQERSVVSPGVALVNNFDPDQKGFVTETMKGFAMLQYGAREGTVGRLAVHTDYGKTPIGSLDQMRLEPGKPSLLYPVAAHGPNLNTTFIRGGKETRYRHYDDTNLINIFTPLTGGSGFADFMIINQSAPVNLVGGTPIQNWASNSALPPSWRYLEINDWRAYNTGGVDLLAGHIISEAELFAALSAQLSFSGVVLTSLDEILPHDPEGNIRRNVRPLTGEDYSFSAAILADDSYWSGTAFDPLKWVEIDEWWQEYGLTAATIQAYFDAHPGAKLY
jgi:hypothetical protein